ncbi:MAG: phosphoribosylaminoimidazole synthetase [Candidatus Nitrosocaldaceae archaeon]|nr:MAG: phosphoribosylaminoimidazole synthetase [Candidatus Nitrosocaldaceae archaeon]
MPYTYKDAGVDVNKVRKIQSKFARLLASTFNDKVISGFGHYAGLYAINDDVIALHTDGVGTKTLIAQMLNKFDTIGIDCIAMNANDIICTGAKPLAFVDYIALRKPDDILVKEIMKGLVKGAKEADVAIIGGETAVMPDLIVGKDQAFDLAGSMIGITKRDRLILGNAIKEGDIIIGLESNGLHSNGYTLARKVLLKHYKLDDKIKELRTTLGKELLKPTRIYVKQVLDIIDKHEIHGLAHITGGAFSKLNRLGNYKFVIDNMPKPKPIFRLIQEHAGLDDKEMFNTFNMGIGFCIISKEKIKGLKNAHIIGRIEKGKGVYIHDIRL